MPEVLALDYIIEQIEAEAQIRDIVNGLREKKLTIGMTDDDKFYIQVLLIDYSIQRLGKNLTEDYSRRISELDQKIERTNTELRRFSSR